MGDSFHYVDPAAVAALAESLLKSAAECGRYLAALDASVRVLQLEWTGRAQESFSAKYQQSLEDVWLQVLDLRKKAEALAEFAEAVERRERAHAAAWQ